MTKTTLYYQPTRVTSTDPAHKGILYYALRGRLKSEGPNSFIYTLDTGKGEEQIVIPFKASKFRVKKQDIIVEEWWFNKNFNIKAA